MSLLDDPANQLLMNYLFQFQTELVTNARQKCDRQTENYFMNKMLFSIFVINKQQHYFGLFWW